MKNALRFIFMTLPFIAAGVAFLAYTIANKPAPKQIPLAENRIAVRVITTKTQRIAPQISGFGLVTPARTYDAIPQVSGTADYVNPLLKKGAILPAGSVLLRLSPADFNLAIAQARANIRAAEAKLAEIAVSETNQTAALSLEQDVLALKTSDLERVERLFGAGTVSQASRDNSRAAHLAQRQKVLNLESALSLLPTQRAVQVEQTAVYKATLETATLNLARTELSLPFAARVASVGVEVGQFVSAGKPAATLNGVAAAEISAQISIADLQSLLRSSGRKTPVVNIDPAAMNAVLEGFNLTATVELDLGGANVTWPAKVDRISDTIDPKTGAVGVIVRVENIYETASPGTRPPLTNGMFVRVVLRANPVDGTVIPRSALRDGHVFIADADNRLQTLPATAVFVQNDIAVLENTIPADTRVVVSTPNPILPGMLLLPTPDADLMSHLAGLSK